MTLNITTSSWWWLYNKLDIIACIFIVTILHYIIVWYYISSNIPRRVPVLPVGTDLIGLLLSVSESPPADVALTDNNLMSSPSWSSWWLLTCWYLAAISFAFCLEEKLLALLRNPVRGDSSFGSGFLFECEYSFSCASRLCSSGESLA